MAATISRASVPGSGKLWTEVTTSEHDHERAALHYLRERFPEREPFRAWANFTFIADDDTRNEVDLLVVSPTGVFLVEIKSHKGRMQGDAGTWVSISPEGKRRTFDNPLLLAEKKAKKLKSLLMRQPAFREARFRDGFYLKAIVFLSNADLTVALDPAGRADVYGPDPADAAAEAPNALPGIRRLLLRVDPRRGAQVDRPLSRAIAQAMDQAGIRESTAHRQVGIYELGELLAEGDGWQDFVCEHPQVRGTKRRIRLYLAGTARSEEERQALTRAATREFKFLQGIEHPGIEKPLEILPNPRGPALVFDFDPEAERLDHWLADHGAELDLLDRIELVRDLAETLRHAHRKGLYHRALAPQHITMTRRDGRFRVRIRDWRTATRELGSSDSLLATGTSHVAERVSEQTHVYLAPETLRLSDAQPGPADIWSLGAVSFLILSGHPPAADTDGLHTILREQGSLTLAAAMDAPSSDLDLVIAGATKVDATLRFVAVDEFLDFLDLALEKLTTPEEKDPIDAASGDVIGGTWKVVRRFGAGSSSVVLLAATDERQEVLKIARDESDAARLRDEYEVLTKLRDRTIVEAYGLERIGGRTVLRIEAALGTLGAELRDRGALSLDLLERFGKDLLDALIHLDEEGVAHRDIKPDNLGIAERGKSKARHLILFDFSLSRADPAAIVVGTRGYLDPFLEEREARRWDVQAERYAAAVTLYEMSAGARPTWGDGSTDPLLTDLQLPSIDADLFDPAVRERLVAFFERGLHRDPGRRFDTAAEMRRAWEQVFSDSVRPRTPDEEGQAAEDVDLSAVTPQTAIVELRLTPRVRSALDRLDVTTVGDLAAIPAGRLVRLAGIGATTRKEISHLAGRIRKQLVEGNYPDADGASVDSVSGQLVPKPPADEDNRTIVRAFLSLVDQPVSNWPTQREVAEQTGLDRTMIADALASARSRWRNRPDVTGIRNELVDLLRRRGGIAGGDELAAILLTRRGSLAAEPLRSRRARAVVRAAVEVESTLNQPRIVSRRLGDAQLFVLDGEITVEEGSERWDADRLTEAAAALGEVAERIVVREPLPSAEQDVRELRAVELPEGVGPFSDPRLVRLAGAASSGVAVSSRLELYPAGMPAARAIEECRAALLDRHGLGAGAVADRVRARFPAAAPLPTRPELDRYLEPLGLRWDGSVGRYVLESRGGILATHYSTSGRTTSFASPDERDAAVRDTEERFERIARDGGFLALTVDRRRIAEAVPAVAARLGGTALDLDRLLIDAMREQAAAANADWKLLLMADAADRGDRRWNLLQRLVDRALPRVETQLYGTSGVAVVSGLGLLARYERVQVIERLRDALTRRDSGHPLRGVVIVVPGEDPSARPVVDGHPVPVVTANQWAHLPSAWLTQPPKGEAA
jgi:serine/threonine protein kinase